MYSPATGLLTVSETLATACRAEGVALVFHCDTFERGSTTSLENLNSTANDATWSVFGVSVTFHFRLSLTFSVFSHGSGASSLLFGQFGTDTNVWCLSVANNSCHYPANPGMIRVFCKLTILNSVFRRNSFAYFLGTSAGSSANVTFVRCVFDGDVVNAANSVDWAIVSLTASPTACLARTPLATRTAMMRPTPEIITGGACASGRKSFSASTFVRDCAFVGLTATKGGAISLVNEAADLWIVACHFRKCRSGDGGAVFARC
jgi:hypothetical protein